MLRIGLTGGIGSGKSAVADCFAALGIEVIDADAVAREVVAPGSPALAEIAAAFGGQFLDREGRLDRARLRAHVFEDPQGRKRLEAILHPRIRTVMEERAGQAQGPYCVLVIPLLLEAGQRDLVDRVLVVDTPVETQYARVAARDGLDRKQIDAILAAQLGRRERLAQADDVVVNDGDLDTLRRRVVDLDRRYRAMAGAQG
ncbi:MAG TPA: dephospho-CoA kinase [Gammaproteobacteria bacterium]|nr:dephospho-CoA kinase [Gammaproteobacteria bacterium]